MNKETIFEKLWADYSGQNPQAREIYALFEQEGEQVVNDHIAFRTFNHPRVNIDVLSEVFTEAGYRYVNDYHFKEKHLYAKHFEHAGDKDAPRVFISELRVEDFSPFLRKTVHELAEAIPEEALNPEDLIFSGCIWGPPSYTTYQELMKESEYAAWLYVHGFRANHFTVSVNHLKKLDSLEKVNAFLKEKGFLLNDSGGEIKGTPAQFLEQSSTKADLVEIRFKEDQYTVPACYYEFARRYPAKDGKLFSGFIAGSADKIFESTDFYKKDN